MSILVLGGAGYIGSHTVYELIGAGREVIVADNLSTGFRAAVHPGAKFYQVDIRERESIEKIFQTEKIDGVIHFAACSQVAESMAAPLKYYDNNLYGTASLLQAMVNHGIDKLVFSSSAAVYGESERIPIMEDDKTEPANCYGETKRSMEKMISWTSKAHGLRYAALRYFNACGAHPSGDIGEAHNPESHLIPLILKVPTGKSGFVSVCGTDYPTRDGTCVRDYVHVTDLAHAHILALDNLRSGGDNGVFNLGNGTGFTVNEVINTARKVTGHPIPSVLSPRRPGDPAQLVASAEKAGTVLGWRPCYNSLESIIATAWNWHKNHPNGFKDEVE